MTTGAGAAGFDYTKICMSGEAAGTGSCPADPVAGTNPNEWACTRDNVTNLVWSIETISNTDWTDATTTHPTSYNSATRCGFSSAWRAPTRRELLSIVHHGKETSPVIDEDFFPNTAGLSYWSSDEYALNSSGAWSVSFSNGYPVTGSKTTNTGRVRLVHGTPLPDGSFTDNGDGTVTDAATGLMWDKCSWGQSGADCSTGSTSTHIWAEALGVAVTANAATYKDYDDWRLPNRTELESLVDITKTTGPTIDTTAFPSTASSWYWTSTTNALGPAVAWILRFDNGNTGLDGKTLSNRVRLVRSGQSFDALAVTSHTVTPSAGANGSISPSTLQTVNDGETTQFTVTPDAAGYTASVGGTCGGTLDGTAYTTDAITADCTVVATFAPVHEDVTDTGSGTATASTSVSGNSETACAVSSSGFVPAPVALPQGVTLPHGMYAFTVENCTPGFSVNMVIEYPDPIPAGAEYWKYDADAGWYTLPATISGNQVSFTVTDGDAGDHTGEQNGTITDPGGIGIQSTHAPGTATPIPTLSEWAMILLTLLLAGMAFVTMRRRV